MKNKKLAITTRDIYIEKETSTILISKNTNIYVDPEKNIGIFNNDHIHLEDNEYFIIEN